jgi:hypothetical protein
MLDDVVVSIADTTPQSGGLPTYLGPGTYLIGVDAEPGLYTGLVSGDSGEWSVSTDPNGENIIGKRTETRDFAVEVQNGQYLKLGYVTLKK